MKHEIWRKRRGQGGFSTLSSLVALGGTATLAGMLLMNSGEQVDAAQTNVCEYDKSIVMTAVESYRLSSDDLTFPTPAGDDGLDEVRSAGWLRNESKYWRYAGLDANGAPQYVLLNAVNGCD